MDDNLSFLVHQAIMTVIMIVVGRAIQRRIGAESAARRIHGRYVLWWCIGGWAIGGPLAVLVRCDPPGGCVGVASFCLLAGWLIGTVHGAIVLAIRRSGPTPPPGGDSQGR